MDKVILVDEQDNEIGFMDKLEAHRKGLLHRAFSILLFNSKGEWLIQKRASGKYHSAGLWSNTCCSHPQPGESIEAAAKRRLNEELLIDATLKQMHSFIYRASLDNGLTEHELDHVLVGSYDGQTTPNKLEVEECKFISYSDLKILMKEQGHLFTPWFKIIVENWER